MFKSTRAIAALPPIMALAVGMAKADAFDCVGNADSNDISVFRLDAKSGLLSAIGNVPTEKQPRGFNIDPTGRTFAAVGELSDAMTVYSINQANGALTNLKSYSVGKKTNGVEFVTFP
jgi:6-phosphogluconolactonase